jgi:predicted MFS family arabinose efflux permease
VWATTIGSVAGPNLAGPAERFSAGLGLPSGSGPFVIALVGFAIALGVILVALRPDPLLLARSALSAPDASPDSGASTSGPAAADSPGKGAGTFRTAWRVLRGTPVARRALIAIAVSHTAMVSVMSMTPVHLDHGGSTYTVIGIVISLHIAGMYVLSPVVGWLADRAGRTPVLVLGMGLLLAAAALAGGAGAHDVTRVTVGLVLLGLGWSCGLISGSAMLSEAVPLEHRTPVQGLSDLLMNVCGATGTVIAGVIVGGLSYGVLGAAVAVMVAVTGAWLALARA